MRHALLLQQRYFRHQFCRQASSVSPLHAYQARVRSGELTSDPLQVCAIQRLERLYWELAGDCKTEEALAEDSGFFSMFGALFGNGENAASELLPDLDGVPRGLFMHGDKYMQ